MPDNASQTKFYKSNYKTYCIFFITNLFLSSLLGLLVAQFIIIQNGIKDLPNFLENGNNLFVNTNKFKNNNEPLVNDVLKSVLLNSMHFNKTLTNVNYFINDSRPKIFNLINYTKSQLLKIDVLLNNNLNQLIKIDSSIKQFSNNNNNPTPSSSPITDINKANTPTIPNLNP